MFGWKIRLIKPTKNNEEISQKCKIITILARPYATIIRHIRDLYNNYWYAC